MWFLQRKKPAPPSRWATVWKWEVTGKWRTKDGTISGVVNFLALMQIDTDGKRRVRLEKSGDRISEWGFDELQGYVNIQEWLETGDDGIFIHWGGVGKISQFEAPAGIERDARSLIADMREIIPMLDTPARKREIEAWGEWWRQAHAEGI